MPTERTRFHDLVRCWTHGDPERGLRHRLTVSQLADYAGVDHGTARDWSEGRSTPTLRTYMALVRGLPLDLAADLAETVHAGSPIETAIRAARPVQDLNHDGRVDAKDEQEAITRLVEGAAQGLRLVGQSLQDGRVTALEAVVIESRARDLRGLCDSLIAITEHLIRHRLQPAHVPVGA